MDYEISFDEVSELEIKQQLCGQFGRGVHKSLEFRWTYNVGEMWHVYDHRDRVGYYKSLQEAVDHYNSIGRR